MNGDHKQNELEDRIKRLEKRISRLEKILERRYGPSQEPAAGAGGGDSGYRSGTATDTGTEAGDGIIFEETAHVEEVSEESWIRDSFLPGENWLHWLGIGLLLLGIVFLFKYSIDQGWLIPPVRSAFGLTSGLGLFLAGLQTGETNPTLRQILLGGGIAAFYITGFATFQLYSFISYPAVWAFMIVVTLLALSLSLQQNEPVLSILGTVGGLGTPFMLYRGEGSLTMLILYFCLILSGSGIIYFFKGWKSLLWANVAGGWLVLLVGFFNNIFNVSNPAYADRWALQAGVLFSTAVFWIGPVVREVLACRNPTEWPEPSSQQDPEMAGNEPFVADRNVQVLAVIIPIATLFYSIGLWSISEEMWGAIALVGSLLLGYTYLPLRREGLKKLSMVHGFTAFILITISLFLLLEGEILLITLALEAFILRIIAAKKGDRNISISSHLLFGIVGVWLLERFMTGSVASLALFNLDALTELFIIGIAGLAVPGYFKQGDTKLIYRLSAHIAFLGWLFKELSVLEDGQAFVTVAWGIYALAVLFIGFWRNIGRLRFIGMATVFLVVAKLFLVDLTQLQTILRILLFIGFGVVFLAAGYLLQQHWGDRFLGMGEKSDDDGTGAGRQQDFNEQDLSK